MVVVVHQGLRFECPNLEPSLIGRIVQLTNLLQPANITACPEKESVRRCKGTPGKHCKDQVANASRLNKRRLTEGDGSNAFHRWVHITARCTTYKIDQKQQMLPTLHQVFNPYTQENKYSSLTKVAPFIQKGVILQRVKLVICVEILGLFLRRFYIQNQCIG